MATYQEAVCYIAKYNYNNRNILHLLDDFLTVDSPNAIPERIMAIMTRIFNKLNIPIAAHKTVGPVTCLEYLGIVLDTVKFEARLPMDKVNRICEFIRNVLGKRSCTKRKLLKLLGHLNFASCVIVPGRSFVLYLVYFSTHVKETSPLSYIK